MSLEDLTLAVKNYHKEFNRYPGGEGELEVSGALLQVLLGRNANNLNPRLIRFIEPPAANRLNGSGLVGAEKAESLLDLWGHPYRLSMDTHGDGKLADPERPGATLPLSVIAWSSGEDGDFATWTDNVKSW